MFEFYYDCFDKCCNWEDFELMFMDIDFFYMVIFEEVLMNIIKFDMRNNFK